MGKILRKKKPVARGNVLVLVWQANASHPSVSLKDMRLKNSKLKGNILSGTIGGGPAQDKFSVEVNLLEQLWRWKYSEQSEFSEWFRFTEQRKRGISETYSSGNLRQMITVFDYRQASQVCKIFWMIHSLEDTRGSIGYD